MRKWILGLLVICYILTFFALLRYLNQFGFRLASAGENSRDEQAAYDDLARSIEAANISHTPITMTAHAAGWVRSASDGQWVFTHVDLFVFPGSGAVRPGGTISYTISSEGSPVSVTLSMSSLPGHSQAAFLPDEMIIPPEQVTLVISTTSMTPVGSYPITITGSYDNLVASVPITLTVEDPDFGIIPQSTSWEIFTNSTITNSLFITGSETFTDDVTLSLEGLPNDIDRLFIPNPVPPNHEALAVLTANTNAPPGNYALSLIGVGYIVSDSVLVPITHTVPISLAVLVADTPTPTPTITETPTETPTPTPTETETPTPTATSTETPTPTATDINSPTPTATGTQTPTLTATGTGTTTPTQTLTPSSTATPTLTPTSSSTSQSAFLPVVNKPFPVGVQILPGSFYYESHGTLYVIGEVLNNTSDSLTLVKVAVNFYDASGQLVKTDSTYLWPLDLPARGRGCFRHSLDLPSNWSYYQFESPTYNTGETSPGLIIFNDSAYYNSTSGDYEIIGQVRNAGDEASIDVYVGATVYNDAGLPVGCERASVNSVDLEPGQTSAFGMTFWGYYRDYSDVKTYRLRIAGDLP